MDEPQKDYRQAVLDMMAESRTLTEVLEWLETEKEHETK